jgi:hypothetical protein
MVVHGREDGSFDPSKFQRRSTVHSSLLSMLPMGKGCLACYTGSLFVLFMML